MHSNEYRGSVRKVATEELPYLSASHNLDDFPSNRFLRTDRSQYSSNNQFNVGNSSQECPKGYVYYQNIPIKICSEGGEHQNWLRVEMKVVNDKNNSAIKISLTDDDNPTFLWCFHLRETDYMNFKNQQKLKVDYAGFPYSLIKMLSKLLGDKNQPMYVCAFQIDKDAMRASLKVFESNEVKFNLNLELKFKVATDQQVKNYLGEKLSRQVEENETLRIDNQKHKSLLERQSTQLGVLTSQLNNIATQNNKERQDLLARHHRKQNQSKAEYLNDLSAQRKEMEASQQALSDRYDHDLKELTEKCKQLQRTSEAASQKIFKLESRQRELSTKVAVYQTEIQGLTRGYEEAKESLRTLESVKFQQEKTITQLSCRLESSTRQLSDKSAIIESNQQLKSNQSSQVQSLESTLSDLRKDLDKKERAIVEGSQEAEKLGQSNKDLQKKIQEYKLKIKERNKIIKDEDAIIEQLKQKEVETTKVNNDSRRENEKFQDDLKSLRKEISCCKEQIEEDKRVIQDNNNLINHLNKQLTQKIATNTKFGPSSTVMQSNYRIPFSQTGYDLPASMAKTSLSPSLSGQRLQPQIKKYMGSTQQHIPKVEALSTLSQEREPQELREHTLRVNAVKYRSPSQSNR